MKRFPNHFPFLKEVGLSARKEKMPKSTENGKNLRLILNIFNTYL